jgi:hypothetical protein
VGWLVLMTQRRLKSRMKLSCNDHSAPISVMSRSSDLAALDTGRRRTLFYIAQTCSHFPVRLELSRNQETMLEKWNIIAQQISTESDPAKLVALVREANLLLHSVQRRPSRSALDDSIFLPGRGH